MTPSRTAYLALDDFLSDDEHESLLAFVRGRSDFTAAHIDQPDGAVDSADVTFRKASVATPDSEVVAMLESRLRAILPQATLALRTGR